MKSRFYLILLMITAAFVAWTYIHYQYQESKKLRLDQLAQLPVYVYMADSTAVGTLRLQLGQLAQIQSLSFESGLDAAREVVKAYGLDLTESTLRDYDFPHVLTLLFKPELASFPARDKALAILASQGIPAVDIDNQEDAWKLTRQELNLLRNRWSNSTLFIAVLLFLLCVFSRLHLSLREALEHKGLKTDFLAALHQRKARFWVSLLLFAVPLLVNLALYYGLLWLGQLQPLVDWQFFCIQAGTLLAASLVAHFLLDMQEQRTIWEYEPINVTTTKG